MAAEAVEMAQRIGFERLGLGGGKRARLHRIL
jgi:hypothetical protein